MALSDTTVRLARATGTDYTLGDADGLALFVTAQGSKSWHFRFWWGGKQPRISLGIYPEISLRDARTRRDEARNLVAKGIDPRVHRRQERAAATAATANTFQAVFRLWCEFKAKALTQKTGRQSTLSQINRIVRQLLDAKRPAQRYLLSHRSDTERIGESRLRRLDRIAESRRAVTCDSCDTGAPADRGRRPASIYEPEENEGCGCAEKYKQSQRDDVSAVGAVRLCAFAANWF